MLYIWTSVMMRKALWWGHLSYTWCKQGWWFTSYITWRKWKWRKPSWWITPQQEWSNIPCSTHTRPCYENTTRGLHPKTSSQHRERWVTWRMTRVKPSRNQLIHYQWLFCSNKKIDCAVRGHLPSLVPSSQSRDGVHGIHTWNEAQV